MPSTTVGLTANADINGILWGNKWSDAQLFVGFPTTEADYGGYNQVNGFQAFDATQQGYVQKVILNYNAVIALDLLFTNTPSNANIRYAEVDSVGFPGDFFNVGTALGITPTRRSMTSSPGATRSTITPTTTIRSLERSAISTSFMRPAMRSASSMAMPRNSTTKRSSTSQRCRPGTIRSNSR